MGSSVNEDLMKKMFVIVLFVMTGRALPAQTRLNLPVISGHRGGATNGYPENCIPTFEHMLAATPAFFEIDPHLTKDSAIVLLYDGADIIESDRPIEVAAAIRSIIKS